MSQVMVPGFSMPATCTGNYKTAVPISAALVCRHKKITNRWLSTRL